MKKKTKRATQNKIVHIVFERGGVLHECIGVLMSENESAVRVAFNAKDDVVKDDLIIDRSVIRSMEAIPRSLIRVMGKKK